jgi:hypothetical protein
MKDDEVNGAYSTQKSDEKCIYNFSVEIGKEETTWETKV